MEADPKGSLYEAGDLDEGKVARFFELTREAELSGEMVIAIAVHDQLWGPAPQWGGVVTSFLGSMAGTVDSRGNVYDPVVVADVFRRSGDHDWWDEGVRWNYVPGRAPRKPDPPRRVFRELMEKVDRKDVVRRSGSGGARLLNWWDLELRLSDRYGWEGYPSAIARIVMEGARRGVGGLPQIGVPEGSWTVAQWRTVKRWCAQYAKRHPRLPELPVPQMRTDYDTGLTGDALARFARGCERLGIDRDDAMMIAVHRMCSVEGVNPETMVMILGEIMLDVEIYGNVSDPVVLPGTVEEVQ